MGWIEEKWEDTWDEIKETGQDVVDFVVDDVVEPVVNTIGNVIETALDNPVKTLAQIAAIVTQQYWALPLIEGADVAAKGGDLSDVLEATAKAYIAGELGAMAGNAVGSAVTEAGTAASYGVTAGSQQAAMLAAQEAGMQTAAQVIGNVAGRAAGAATVAVVYGTDPVKAFVTGGVSAAVPAVLGQVPGFDKLPNTAKEVISSSVAAQLTGGNVTAAAISAAVRGSGVVTSILNNYDPPTDANGNPIPPEKRKMNDAQRALATQTLSSGVVAAFMGKPVSPAIQQALIRNGTTALGNMLTAGFKTSTDKVTTQVEKTNKTATAMEQNIAQQKVVADSHNAVAAQLNERVAKQGELKTAYDNAVAAHNANPSQATADAANAAAKVYNDYATALSTDYTNSFKPLLDARQAELTARQKEFDDLEAVYKDEIKAVTEATSELKAPLDAALLASDKAFVAALDPNFNPDEYRKINNLGADVDVYDHWLGDGQFKGLATNQKDADVKASIDRYVAATGKQPPDDVRSVLGVSSNPSRDVAVKEYVDTAIKDQEQREKFTDAVNQSIYDAYKAEGLTDAQISQRIDSGEAGRYFDSAVARKKESVANLQQYAKTVRDAFGYNSPEYKAAYREALDAMAEVGGYGVVKDGDSFTHTTAGKFDGDTGWNTTNTYFENPVTGQPNVIVSNVSEVPSAIRALYRRMRGEDGGLSAIWALGQSANPPSSGGGSIFGDGSGMSSGLPGLTLLAQDNGMGDAGAKMFGSSNGFALLTYSDGRAAVVNPQTLEVELLTPEQIREIEKTQPLKDIKPAVVESEVKDPKLIEEKPPEVKPPEEKPPEVKPPEEKPPEVKPPEVKPPEVKPPEVKPPEKVDAAKFAAEAVKNNIQTPQDVTDAMKALGYTPTPDEVKQFTGDKTPEQLKTEVTNFTDPRTVTAEEVLAAYRELGLDKPTQSDINKLVGQYAQTDLPDKAKQNLNTAQYNSALERLDAAGKDAAANAAKVLEKAAEYEKAGAARDAALAKAIETVATEAGATKAAIGSEANLPTRDDAANAMKVITGSAPYDKKYDWDGNGKIELPDAINMLKAAAGMETSTPPSPDTPWNKSSGLYAKLDAVQKNVLDKAAEYEAAGATRDAAITKAVEAVAKDLGTTKEAIGEQIGAPATTDANGKPVEATGVYKAIADSAASVQKNVLDKVAEYEAAGATRDAAITKAVEDVAKDLGTTKEAIGNQIGAPASTDASGKPVAATGVYKAIADNAASVQKNVLDKVAEYEAAGATRDAAITKAVEDVAKDLGTTKEAIGNQIGAPATTDASGKPVEATGVYKAIADSAAASQADAQAKYNALSAGQKQLADDLVKQGSDLGSAIATVEANVKLDAQAKYDALSAGQKQLADDLAKQGVDLGVAIETAAASARTDAQNKFNALDAGQKQLAADLVKQGSDLGSAIATVEANIKLDAQAKYDALSAGQKKIADDLMRQGVTLSAAINTAVSTATENIKADAQVKYDALSAGQKKLTDDLVRQGVDLNTAIQTAQTELSGRIGGLETTLGTPGRTASRSDLDEIINILNTQGAYDPRYDYNADGRISPEDRDAIANYLGGTATGPFTPGAGTVWAPSGIYGTMAQNQAALEKKIADEAEATRAANAARTDAAARASAASALKTQRMGNLNTMMGLLAQPNAMGGQRVAAPAAPPESSKIGYVYDFSSIFANPAQEKLFVNPYGGYAQGGTVRSEMDDVNDELLKILKG